MTAATLTSRPLDDALELERDAYNAAFYDLGLRWYWDADTFAQLQANPDPRVRVRRYIETQHPHLLRAYDPDFLAEAIEARRCEHQRSAGSPGRGCRFADVAVSRAAELGI